MMRLPRGPSTSAASNAPSGAGFVARRPGLESEPADGVLRRLRRLEGQVHGIHRMVRQGRACLDVLTQLTAARGAIREIERLLLRGHLERWVVDATRRGRGRGRRIAEIVAALMRLER